MNNLEATELVKILSSDGITSSTLIGKLSDNEIACRKAFDKFLAAQTESEAAEAKDILTKCIDDLYYRKASIRILEQAERMASIAKVKESHSDAIVLLCVNDAYHIYGDDAVEAAQILRLESPQEVCNTPVVTFPLEDFDKHLCKFIRAGKRVAIMGEAD